jgi:hypothetical protein
VNAAAWVLLTVLPLAAPPKLLVNTQVETVSAAGGLDPLFQKLLAQPGWIGTAIPLAPRTNLGCEYVSPGGWSVPGVVHLEPPDHAVVLFRAEGGAVTRIRVLSPDCEIDAGGAALHWVENVRPADITALLKRFATARSASDRIRESAAYALSLSREPGALEIVIDLARHDPDRRIRQFCVSALARSKDPRAAAFFTAVFH